jgi:succinate dehydrogenase / fumarate reductase flavoprotein subunit
MAIGEAACVSVHGANRLGSNSLLDIVVFGRAAAIRAAETIKPDDIHKAMGKGAIEKTLDDFDAMRHASGGTPTAEIRNNLQQAMQTNCAVFRTGEILAKGVAMIDDVWRSFSDVGVSDRSMVWNSDLVETWELKNLIQLSLITVNSANNRTESRGGHAREDYPDRDDENWMKHTVAWLSEDGGTTIDYRPVHMYTLTDEVEVVPPKARVY